MFAALMFGGVSVRAATTNYYWIATSPDDFGNSAAWDLGVVPNDPNAVAYTTNDASITYSALDNFQLYQLQLGVLSDSPGGTLTMNGGTLSITNNTQGGLSIGGHFGGSDGTGATAAFILNGGTVTVVRNRSTFYQDDIELASQPDATGTLTVNGGLLNAICNIQIGYWGHGIMNITGGTVIEDSGLLNVGDGQGSTAPTCSGELNLSGGVLYILRNHGHEPSSTGGGGLAINRRATNSTVNISGGTLYCAQINTGSGINSTVASQTENLNVSGGDIYVGFAGVININSGGNHTTEVDISGGTFHTVDLVEQTNTDVTQTGNTNTAVLSDGANWAWDAAMPVNLTNSTMLVNGVSGPGYVTFAPETNRTITLNNAWSGVGGLTVDGPGTVALGGANTYSGDTTISQGTLALTGSGSIASPNIVVAGGATFDTSASSFSLGAGQTLTNSSSGAVVNGLYTSSGTVSLVYDGATPPLTTVSGTLTLDSATVFNVNNTGPALTVGNYKIISSTGGTVAGTMPSVSVSGGGIVAGSAASLFVSGGELYLSVAAAPIVLSQSPSNNISLYVSQNYTLSVNVSGSDLSYHWLTNGVADTTAGTGPNYVLSDVQQAMSGTTYECFITNSLGFAYSQPVTLTVQPLPSFLTSSAYSTNLMAMRPTAYWPMHETTPAAPGDIETNYGTLGAVGNGYYADWDLNNGSPGNQWIQHQLPGALTNDSDGAAEFNINGSTNSYLLVPHTSPGTTLRPPFTVECWVYSADTGFGDIVSQDGTKLNGGNANNKYGFRLSWNRGKSIQTYGTAGGLTVTNTPLNEWHYVAVTYDGTNLIMYVDGTNNVGSTTHTGYLVDYWDPLTIGAGMWNGGGPTRMASHLVIDEVAVYDKVLDATTVDDHYNLGTTGAAGQYFDAVTNSQPVLYYRMNAPAYSAPPIASWPVLTNYGTVPINGAYTPGTSPGGVAGPTDVGGSAVSGLSSLDAMPGNGLSSFADAGYNPAFDPTGTTPMTISAWFKGNPADSRFQNILGHSDNSWRIDLAQNGKVHFNAGAGGEITSTGIYNDGNWHQAVAVYDGATNYLYVDGVLDSEKAAGTNGITGSTDDVLLGADPQYVDINKGAGRQFAGNLCEVAFWNGTALDAAQVKSLYLASGQDLPPVVANIVTNTVAAGLTAKIAISDLETAAGWSDPDGNTVTLSSVDSASANGTNITSDATYIYYNGAAMAEDHFTYTVTDGFLTTTGMVYLEPVAAAGVSINTPGTDVSGHPTFSGSGIPGYTYGVESTTNLSTTPWIEAGTVMAGTNGVWSFTDSNQVSPASIFYRLYYPDNPSNPPQ